MQRVTHVSVRQFTRIELAGFFLLVTESIMDIIVI